MTWKRKDDLIWDGEKLAKTKIRSVTHTQSGVIANGAESSNAHTIKRHRNWCAAITDRAKWGAEKGWVVVTAKVGFGTDDEERADAFIEKLKVFIDNEFKEN